MVSTHVYFYKHVLNDIYIYNTWNIAKIVKLFK